jgi:predicted ATPase
MGRFDPLALQRPQPHAAFVEAFAGFVTCTVGRGEDVIRKTRKAIQKAVGSETNILIDMVPELAQILGTPEQDVAEINHSSEAVKRFNLTIRNFLQAVSSPEQPFVILLDNLHWADLPSIELLLTLLNDKKVQGLMLIATYRVNDEVSLCKMEDLILQVKSCIAGLTWMQLDCLDEAHVNTILSSRLERSDSETEALANVVYKQTKGNPYFLKEFIHSLCDRNLMRLDPESGRWEWSKDEVTTEFTSLLDLISRKLHSLPDSVLYTLKVASCLGPELDEDLLKSLIAEPVFPHIQLAASRGLVGLDYWRQGYRFTHDAIREEVYQMIPKQDRGAFHFDIGRRLWSSFDSPDDLDEVLFVVSGQFMLSHTEPSTLKERQGIVEVLLRTGERAARMSSFGTAFLYLSRAVEFLGDDPWNTSYTLSLEVFNALAEMAYCTANFDSVASTVSEITQHARRFEDTYRSQATKLYALGSSGRTQDAISHALSVLKSLGEVLPTSASRTDLEKAMKKTNKLVKGMSNDSIINLPAMTDHAKLACMQILNLVFEFAYLVDQELATLAGFRIMQLSLEHGVSAVSCVGFVTFAMCLCG